MSDEISNAKHESTDSTLIVQAPEFANLALSIGRGLKRSLLRALLCHSKLILECSRHQASVLLHAAKLSQGWELPRSSPSLTSFVREAQKPNTVDIGGNNRRSKA